MNISKGNLYCGVAAEYTGPDPQTHSIHRLVLISYKGDLETINGTPLDLRIKFSDAGPKITPSMSQSYKDGLSQLQAAQMVEYWFNQFNLRDDKRLIPIAYNWPKISLFLVQWLGWETFTEVFHEYDYRDLICTAGYANDRAGYRNDKHPYINLEQTAIFFGAQIVYDATNRDTIQRLRYSIAAYRHQVLGGKTLLPD
jgi:hypothetical protein